MDYNTFLLRFGLDPNQFLNASVDPISCETGFIYEVQQIISTRSCPKCGCQRCVLHDYKITEVSANQNASFRDTLRIKKPRLYCPDCGKTHMIPLKGISRDSSITQQTIFLIVNDFEFKDTFKEIADRYSLSITTVLNLFDKYVPEQKSLKLPKYICVDEFKFDISSITNYACVISDFETHKIIDILPSRRIEVLRHYFGNIPLRDREEVKVLISDMYDGYDVICNTYLPKAVHAVDLFHIVKLLNEAINRMRTYVMKNIVDKNSIEYNFLKKHRRLFLANAEKIGDISFHFRKTNQIISCKAMLNRCLSLDNDFFEGYNCLQELQKYSSYSSYEDSLNFVIRLANRLKSCENENLQKVGKTYERWKYEIANGLNTKTCGKRFTNGTAENINNHIKTLIKCGYGYRNFQRFRNRVLLIDRKAH